MSNRRKRNTTYRERERKASREKRHPAPRSLSERLKGRSKTIAVLAVAFAVLVVLAVLSRGVPPDYDGCFPNQPTLQHYHFWVFVQLGDDNYTDFGNVKSLFLKNTVAPIDSTAYFGLLPASASSTCAYPMHVNDDDPASRGPYFTYLHVEAPFTEGQHAYTLGDLFAVWGSWIHARYPAQTSNVPVYFAGDGVSKYRGAVDVKVAYGEDPFSTNPWGFNYTSVPGYGSHVLPQGTPFVWIVLHDPYTTIAG